jgi:diguanylate cyclase (GGDEF)-like protein
MPEGTFSAALASALPWLGGAAVLAAAAAWRLRRRAGPSIRETEHPEHHRATAVTANAGRDGLASRAEFDDALAAAAHRCDRILGSPLALFHIGFDDFRDINEGLGGAAGSALMRQVASRLARVVDGRPWVTRLSDEEFALFHAVAPEAASALAQHLAEDLARPFVISDVQLRLAVSIGAACYPEHGAWSRLVGHAALAMRQVRQGGGNGYAMFDPVMAVTAREQALLLQDLRMALANRQLQLVYQPKVDAKTLQVTAAEALLRWVHPQRGMVSPSVFVPLAERHGLIDPIGRWVIDEACRQAALWRGEGLRMRIAVNLSAQQLRHEQLVPHIEAALARHGIPAGRLTCEITESVAMEDTEHTRAAFERLRAAGLHVSIDDFGTGHSSLAALRNLPAAEIKIDRAFVTDLGVSEKARSNVEAVLQMTRTLGLRAVAEGVETEAQRDVLVQLGCDEMQGFLFAKPMSPEALAVWAHDEPAPGRPVGFRPSLFQTTSAATLES